MAENTIHISDQYTLNHSREVVWQNLNDPEILAHCIKGCAFVERESAQKFKAVIQAKLGELKKDFKVELNVDDEGAPQKYALSSEVGAGVLGKVRGVAMVNLDRLNKNQTRLDYTAVIRGGGVIGKALPLIEGLASRRVRAFFDAFVIRVDGN